jgi:adenosylhomocysteinase
MPLTEAAGIGDVFVTVTGDKNVIAGKHFERMKDGAIVANSGHFNVEIDIPALENMAVQTRKVRDFVKEYALADKRKIFLLADGRLLNLAAAEGHPASVMDMSFANQALSAKHLMEAADNLPNQVFAVPIDIDEEIARLKLKSMGINIDTLTAEQKEYLAAWQEGT